jgi:membrane peptidoglycan carboxypeptidase
VALLVRRAVIALLSAAVTVAGLVALTAWAALRTQWDLPEPATAAGPTVVLDRDGEVLLRFTAEVDRTEVAIDDIAPLLTDAVIAAEDARFYEHEGVDPWSLVRAVVTNVRTGGITQGGSTITQQLAKNMFLSGSRSWLRKAQEAAITWMMERTLSKRRILEIYLNVAEWGEGIFGAEAAEGMLENVRRYEVFFLEVKGTRA